MNLYNEILVNLIKNQETCIKFPHLQTDAIQAVELECCAVLQKIKTVIEDDSLCDFMCALADKALSHLFFRLNSQHLYCENRLSCLKHQWRD